MTPQPLMDAAYARGWAILIVFAIGAIIALLYRHFGHMMPAHIPDSLKRSDDCRKRYFKHNKGLFGKGIYFCPYCGKTLWRKKQIEIDHINAVHRVQKSALLRKRFAKLPNGVNNIRNLVHSCSHCNQRKGSKGGIWIFMGHFGQYFMPVLRAGVIGSCAYLVAHAILFAG